MSSGVGKLWYFRLDGSVQRTDDPYDSPLTDWACEQVHLIRREQLSPSGWLIDFPRAPQLCRDAFHPEIIAQWSRWDGKWDWAHCSSRSSIEEFIRSEGGMRPWVHAPIGGRPDIERVRKLIAEAGL